MLPAVEQRYPDEMHRLTVAIALVSALVGGAVAALIVEGTSVHTASEQVTPATKPPLLQIERERFWYCTTFVPYREVPNERAGTMTAVKCFRTEEPCGGNGRLSLPCILATHAWCSLDDCTLSESFCTETAKLAKHPACELTRP